MKKLMMVAGAIAFTAFATGCSTMSPEERRAEYQEEYERLAALPPAQMIVSPSQEICNCARLSCDLFNEAHSLMRAYVAKTEANREYTGFMNDVRYYVEEEKMSNQDACRKVMDAVIAADASRPDDQKVWPKIQKGIAAVNELDPAKQLTTIAVLSARNLKIEKSAKDLPNTFKQGDFMSKAQRFTECTAITGQLADAAACLAYLGDQYTRVVELDNFAR